MKILIKMKEIIAIINKNETNIIITTLIKKIKEFLKLKCELNSKIDEISKNFIKIKREILKVNTFKITNNVKSFLILRK